MDYSKCRKGLGINEMRTSCKVFTSISWALNGITLDENLAGKNPIQQQKERTLSLNWHGYLLTKKVVV